MPKKIKVKKFNSAAVLIKIAKFAKRVKGSSPKDLSTNHDYYIWGGEKRSKE